MPDPAQGPLRMSSSDDMQVKRLTDTLPDLWTVCFDDYPEMEWVAFIHHVETPTCAPLFTICRWFNCVGVFVRWEDDAPSAVMFTELSSAFDLIQRGIFAEGRMTSSPKWTESCADTKH